MAKYPEKINDFQPSTASTTEVAAAIPTNNAVAAMPINNTQ